MNDGKMGVIVLAGTSKAARQIRWRLRFGLFRSLFDPGYRKRRRANMEARIASAINRDDYIWGENKALIFLHPDLTSQKNVNFLKRAIYFAQRSRGRMYSKRKSDMFRYLSVEGEAPLSLVVRSVARAEEVDKDHIVVVGPKIQIDKELHRIGMESITVANQGRSLGENILIGGRSLAKIGYEGEYVLIIGGDVPLADSGDIDRFIRRSRERGGTPDIFWGMGSRSDLRDFIRDTKVEHLGRIGPNRPKKGYLNKFGIPILDDTGQFGDMGNRQELMMGNLFLYRKKSINRDFINRLYSMRKMLANPFYYFRLGREFGKDLLRAAFYKVSLSEAEYIFNLQTGIELKVVKADPSLTMDLDSYSDLRRICAIMYRKAGDGRDLETDLLEYLRERKMERKRKKKSGGKAARR
ncbi:MAG: hypothetical protein ACMUIG_06620 [Thermoplasmatota archaeon]